jgi:hypothetical protein
MNGGPLSMISGIFRYPLSSYNSIGLILLGHNNRKTADLIHRRLSAKRRQYD